MDQPKPVQIDLPRQLPTTSMVKQNLLKAKSHLDNFDKVIKVRTKVTWQNEDIMCIAMHSYDDLVKYADMEKSYIDEYNKCLEFEAELVKKKDMVEKDVYNELSNRFSRLEKHCISVEVLDLQPLSPKLRKNREAHVNYLKVTKENADTLRDIVEEARASKPSDNALDYDCIHDMCVVDYLNDVNARARDKSKSVKKNEWKHTGLRKKYNLSHKNDMPPRDKINLEFLSSQSHWLEMHGSGLMRLKDQLIKMGSDDIELSNEKGYDFEDECSSDVDETAKIFKIEDNLLDYETPLLLVKLEEFWWKVNAHEKASFARWENYGQGPYANAKTKKDYDPNLDNYANNAGDTRDTKKECHDPSVCYIRRFEMIKYSFKDDEEYVAIKENEYDDLTNTSKEAIHAYQEIFCMMDEG
ncbi:hypothetical protein Tco_0635999 [Tanacetum coccineum]